MPDPAPRRSRGLVAIDGALALIAVLLIVQMWLLSATLGAYLNGRRSVALPGAVVSIVLFAATFALSRFVNRVDRESRSS